LHTAGGARSFDAEEFVRRVAERERTSPDSATRKMPPDEFLHRVKQRAGVGPDRARQYIRAVLATMQEAAREEFFDVAVQLPAGYRDLIAAGPAHRNLCQSTAAHMDAAMTKTQPRQRRPGRQGQAGQGRCGQGAEGVRAVHDPGRTHADPDARRQVVARRAGAETVRAAAYGYHREAGGWLDERDV
jgi:uncharacterized protein (DUF2267 family)